MLCRNSNNIFIEYVRITSAVTSEHRNNSNVVCAFLLCIAKITKQEAEVNEREETQSMAGIKKGSRI